MNYYSVILLAIVALTALISVVVSREVTLFQLDQKFGFSLFQKRTDSYALLFEILANFMVVIEFGKVSTQGELDPTISKSDILQFLLSIEEWNSKHSIFVTGYTTDILNALRRTLYKLLEMTKEQVEEEFTQLENKKALQDQVASLAVAIKNELGVYAIRPFPTNKEFKNSLLQMLPN